MVVIMMVVARRPVATVLPMCGACSSSTGTSSSTRTGGPPPFTTTHMQSGANWSWMLLYPHLVWSYPTALDAKYSTSLPCKWQVVVVKA